MKEKEPSEFTAKEFLEGGKKLKHNLIINAALIGFLIGIIIYSVIKNSVGFLTLIPLLLAYKLIKNSLKNKK
ncbi:FUSC family protein [Tenacibaculum sp. AHE15PA]|uniref:FUSC family protein n=1 Tax=unclassified Tenacibaculum TaxID=2635139 RepID=UPI001C4F114F|nr:MULTISPECIES: FUSC family protein [unclassified Tenacibaculum]QXP73708.1 FUSC family protein [Tenacibaculum sp. AHE14PA]QXP75925.1 FUSC family protein [Tenacibaculum sp. AHE15PA]